MLPKSEHVQQVYYAGDNNLLSADKSAVSEQRTKLFIECSTIDPMVTREAGDKVKESGLGQYADAAVSVSTTSHHKKESLANAIGREVHLVHVTGRYHT